MTRKHTSEYMDGALAGDEWADDPILYREMYLPVLTPDSKVQCIHFGDGLHLQAKCRSLSFTFYGGLGSHHHWNINSICRQQDDKIVVIAVRPNLCFRLPPELIYIFLCNKQWK